MDFLNILKAGTKLSKKSNPIKKDEVIDVSQKKSSVKISGNHTEAIHEFDDLSTRFNVPSWIIENMKFALKFKTPSPIQANAWPLMLEGNKLLASAPTGSGKTMAFLVPLLVQLKSPGKEFCRALIIQPSRELAQQTLREFQVLIGSKKFKARVLDGFVGNTESSNAQIRKLDLCVSTPLKLIQLLKDGAINLKDLQHLVLDEADKLLDMGFQPQIDEILSHVPEMQKVSCHLFSATLPEGVIRLAESMIANPVRVAVGAINSAAASVHQELVFTTHEDGKLSALRQLIKTSKLPPPCLIFVQSKERAKQLFQEMIYEGWLVDVMHAERTKQERDTLIQSFRAGKIWFLICTDLMARGVDFKGVRSVLNYDLPQSSATYIHRVGRTGRADKTGKAFTFFTTADMSIIRPVVNVMNASGCDVPEYLLKTKKLSKDDRKNLQKNAPDRRNISQIPSDGQKRKYVVFDEEGKKSFVGEDDIKKNKQEYMADLENDTDEEEEERAPVKRKKIVETINKKENGKKKNQDKKAENMKKNNIPASVNESEDDEYAWGASDEEIDSDEFSS